MKSENNNLIKVTPQVTPQVEQLIVALDEDLSRDNLQAKLELKDREHFSLINS